MISFTTLLRFDPTRVAALALLGLSAPLASAADAVRFGHLTIEDGLSHNWVYAITKDSRGFLWFGTQDGLNRYDGAGLKVYRHAADDPTSLPSSGIGVLYEDRERRLWVGCTTGLALYDREHDRFTTFLPNPGQGVGNNVRAVLHDKQGALWLGTDNGVARLDPKDGRMRRFPLAADARAGQPDALVASLFEDSKGRFWVGTGQGLVRFDRQSGEYQRWTGAATDLNGLHRADVWDFYEDREGRLWIATLGSGLHQLDAESGKDVRYLPDPRDPDSISHARVRRIVSDGGGTLYLGTENGGLNAFDTQRGTFRRFLPDIDDDTSLNSQSLWSLFLDDQGTLWIGTFNGGVNYTSPYLQRFQRLRAGRGKLTDPHVGSVLEDRSGKLWIGTDGGGLNRYDPLTGSFTSFRSKPGEPTTIGSDAVWALLEDSRGSLWLGGWDGGLGRLDRATGKVQRYRNDPANPKSLASNHIWRILELKTGELLVVTQAGADLFDRDNGTFRHLTDLYPGAGEDVLYSAAEDALGNLWIVGNSFVGYLDRKSGKVTRYRNDPNDPNSLGAGWTQAVLIDSAGNVWFGSEGGLSCREAKTGRFRRYTTAQGLSHSTIVGLVEDAQGSLWVATGRGLDKFVDAVKLPAEPKFFNFDLQDGLQGQEFARNVASRGASEQLYFGGSKGLNSFRPDQVLPNPVAPKVVLTDLRISNQSVRPGAPNSPLQTSISEAEELVLSHRDSVVSFSFAALNYVLPRKNKYAYRLEGFETAWTPAAPGQPATYTNLPRGQRFTFRVKASNNDGVWNEQGAALRVYVTPRFYERPVTWVLSALLLIAAAGFVYRNQVKALKLSERRLAQQVQEKTAGLQHEIAEHKHTEERLARENEERRRAEAEAHDAARQLRDGNTQLLQQREALQRENTERRRAEEAAGRERDLLRALMDNIPDLIYFKDREGRFLRINAAQAHTLGAPDAEAALGKTDADFLSREFAQASLEEERELFRTGQPLLGKLQHDIRQGRWFLATKVPTRAADGTVTGLVGISKDITERKLAENRLELDLEHYLEVVSAIARGDLTQRGAEGEETLGRIARSMNGMLTGFASILVEVQEAAFAVSSSSAEILVAATQIAKGAEYGSGQVESTSVAVEEMAASMNQVSKNALASSEKARLVMEHVARGDQAANVAADGMARIDLAATETAEKMRLLERRSREIFEIIDLIEDISAQSALLSLNAAIEAAHAGDAGRGFAVVAEEVRRLADRSKEATARVALIVDAMVTEVKAALAAMEHAMLEVQQGRKLSAQAIESLGEISGLVQESASLSEQISNAAREQTSVTNTVVSSMSSIANVTHESAAGAKSTTTAVRDLVVLAERLTGAISRFKLHRSGP